MKNPRSTIGRPVARGMWRLHSILLPVAAICGGCVSDDATGRFERHINAGVWGDAVAGITDDPWQWGTTGALAVAWPIAANNDDGWSESLIEDEVVGSSESTGDYLLYGMMGASLGYAGYEWYEGDEGVATEVLVEAALFSTLVVEGLKDVIDRERPEGSLENSFPSGHANMAFVTATFVARRVADETDTAWGYLGYVPATLVALNRVEQARHFPSDVVVGALIGTVFTNVFYNAHYGSEDRPGIIVPRAVAQVEEDYIGLGFEVRF